MHPLWSDLASRAGLSLNDDQNLLLSRYLDLLLEANARMNLTRITDRAAADVQHVGDALTLLPFLPEGACRLADVGSGGGVPGLPLAIVRPEARVTLIESTKKKGAFLRDAAQALALSNVTVVDQRAEDAGRGEVRQTFDIAVARAVATMDWLAEWCLPLVKKGGAMLAMKGPKVVDELPAAAKAIKLLGGGPAEVHPAALGEDDGRVIVRIPKIAKTPLAFPRPATQAKNKPIR